MQPVSWVKIGRILLKTALFFLLFNLLFALTFPLEAIGRFSLYNNLFTGRTRLPYGENPSQAYNLSLNNLPAMFASHQISQPKADDEFRVLLLGDSGVWGWFLPADQTLAAQLNDLSLKKDGRSVTVHNLGYPILSVSKDLLMLDAAMQHQPDLIIWLVTLDALPRDQQLAPPLLQNNPAPMRRLISAHGLQLDPADSRFVEPNLWQRTIVGQRRPLADWLRLQALALPWSVTGVDQVIPDPIPLRQTDYEVDESWQSDETSATLAADDLALDVLAAGATIAGDLPLLLVNEPIFISSGENSNLRYNLWYPRWAYDQYRPILAQTAVSHPNITYLDLWDAVPPDQFSDSPVHLTAAGTAVLAQAIVTALSESETDSSVDSATSPILSLGSTVLNSVSSQPNKEK